MHDHACGTKILINLEVTFDQSLSSPCFFHAKRSTNSPHHGSSRFTVFSTFYFRNKVGVLELSSEVPSFFYRKTHVTDAFDVSRKRKKLAKDVKKCRASN